jgi:MFS family permease
MSEAVDSIGVRVSEAAYPVRAVGWYATILLAVLYWLSILDRFIISLLVDPIKRDLGLTDLQFGMLHGFAFAATFALFGLAFGSLADRVSRRWVIFAGVSVWSLATALCGLAQNFWHLLLARIGVGAGEAALNPCATSMLADLFPPQRLTLAMAVYAMGSTVGAGSAFLIGGAIVDFVSQFEVITLPFVGKLPSWQAVFFIVGVPGALLAFTIFTVPEPVRRGHSKVSQTGRSWRSAYVDLLKFVKSRPRFLLCHYAGFTLASAVLTGNAAWYPVHMVRSFGWSASRIGLILGLTLMAAGITGKLIGGRIVDAMYQRGYRDAQIRWYSACLLIATPIGLIATTSGNPWVFLVAIGVFMVLVASMPACAMTALNLVTPNELRGTGVAVFTTVSALIGGGAGAVAIAAVSEHVFRGESTIGLGMATLIGICCPLGAVSLALGFRAMRDAMAEAERLTIVSSK